jgi:signal transduction histidine kinase
MLNMRIQFLLAIYALLVFSAIPFGVSAQDTLVYSDKQTVVDIGKYVLFRIDKHDAIDIYQILKQPDTQFEQSKKQVLNFANTIASVGIKLYIKNLTDQPLYLSFENNELQQVELLTMDESGQVVVQKGGTLAPIANRYLQRSNTILEVGQKPILVCIKAKTYSSFYFPTNLGSLPALMNAAYKKDVFNGIVLGILLAMCFYNLFIFFIVKDRLYLLYCLYVVMGMWTYTHLNGLWFFAWSDYPFLNRFLGIQLFALSAALFSFRFLNSKVLTPRLYKVMLVMFTIIALLIPLDYLNIQPFTNNFLQLFIVFGICVLFSAGVAAYLAGHKSAKYYILAWVLFLSGSTITLLSFVGWVPFNFWTFNASAIGACIENLFLSFALANRINVYREESAQAQALAIERLQENERLVMEQNKNLEEKVHKRTVELEKSLLNLQAAQAQLIQSEKLASLGELTAGIAHEIQNPLNFVNNFSDLSIELVDDIQGEMKKPDTDQSYLDELFTDLRHNQQKINHHGKRASSIVRGMLEHSRTSRADKELADLNQLADEYLRLAYHGIRAKDKTFVADFKTEISEPTTKVSVIRQDIGRVLLNLMNNAFYAVKERSKNAESDAIYQPLVTVSTWKEGQNMLIRIKDNGTGMPENVKSKVFQPFFTTKPTGEGTGLGLGLSLSYDIITKGHRGTLEVNSIDGVGTEFIITLPMN